MSQDGSLLREVFPFHLQVNTSLRILSVGRLMSCACPEVVVGEPLERYFGIESRSRELLHEQRIFEEVVQCKAVLRRHSVPEQTFRGGWYSDAGSRSVYFLGGPWITQADKISEWGISLRDIPLHSPQTDLLLLLRTNQNTLGDVRELAQRLQEAKSLSEARVAERTQALNEALVALKEQNVQLVEQRKLIEYQATHDALTGLPLWRLARDRLEMAMSRARRQNSKIAVLFIDLDGFKATNDTFGHEAGDHVLKVVASRLTSSIRSVDTAARHGGDEFVVVLSDILCASGATTVARELITAVSQPIPYEEGMIGIGSSVGIAMFPDDALTPEEAVKRADQAMYAVKRSGRNNFALYSA